MIKINNCVFPSFYCPRLYIIGDRPRKVDKAYLVQVTITNAYGITFLVAANCKEDAIDKVVDDKKGACIVIDDEEEIREREEGGYCSYGGNESVAIDLDTVYIERVKSIDYFYREDISV